TAVTGGNPVSITISLNYAAPADAEVSLSSSDPSISVPSSAKLSAGQRQVTFTQATHAVTTVANVTIRAAYGGQSQSAVVVVRPLTVSSVVISPAHVFAGATVAVA